MNKALLTFYLFVNVNIHQNQWTFHFLYLLSFTWMARLILRNWSIRRNLSNNCKIFVPHVSTTYMWTLPLLAGDSDLLQPYFQRFFLKNKGYFNKLKKSPYFWYQILCLSISLFLKKNLPLDRRKKFICMVLFSLVISCISDWRFREFYPCRKFHLAWGVPDESRAVQWHD
jgi:hypothetical protein